MFVKLLIGRNAGSIVDMRTDAAQAGLAAGSCVKPTDEEMAAAKIPIASGAAAAPETMPPGYEARPNEEDGGWNVIAPDGSKINAEPLRNLAQARDVAWQHAQAAPDAPAGDDPGADAPTDIPEGYADLPWTDLRALAMKVAPDLRNPSKADCLAAIEAALAKRAEASA